MEADNGEQALKNLNGDVVDLILVDLEIPSLQDVEKIRVLQKRHPELKVIAMAEAFGNDFLRAAEQLGAQPHWPSPSAPISCWKRSGARRRTRTNAELARAFRPLARERPASGSARAGCPRRSGQVPALRNGILSRQAFEIPGMTTQ